MLIASLYKLEATVHHSLIYFKTVFFSSSWIRLLSRQSIGCRINTR